MSQLSLDLDPLHLGADWFNQLFDEIGIEARIESVAAKSIGTGQIGENVRFTLTYRDGKGGGPDSLVGKFPTTNEASLLAAKMLGHYEREVKFYRTFPKAAGVITPKVYYTDYDPETNRFALIMRDMAPAEQGDQLVGCSVAEAELAMKAGAVLHAAYWNDPSLDTHAWLQRTESAPPSPYGPAQMAELWYGFKQRFGADLDEKDVMLGDAFAQRLPDWWDVSKTPYTLVHNDFRLDNMLFSKDDSPKSVTVVDWQTAGKGSPARDISYFIGAGLTREARPQHEMALLEYYLACLQAEGVTEYRFDDLYRDYCLSSFYGFSMAFGAAMLVKRTERGDQLFLTMLRRHGAQARDNDALALLSH